MKKIFKSLLLLTISSSATLPMMAQRWVEMPKNSTPMICISETVNEAPDVVEIFQNTQGNYFHDPRAPRFILVDQKGKWGLGIGGYLQAKTLSVYAGSSMTYSNDADMNCGWGDKTGTITKK